MVHRYGVENPGASPEIRAKIDYVASARKARQTMKLNRTFGSSKPEDKLFEMLTHAYGLVERQSLVNGQFIDFYVPSIDTYVQLDGVYWHGLDRPIDEIARHKTHRDRGIYNGWLRDREQDAWFKANGKHLVRITDVELKTMGVAVLERFK